MNTHDEIQQAISDYSIGLNGFERWWDGDLRSEKLQEILKSFTLRTTVMN